MAALDCLTKLGKLAAKKQSVVGPAQSLSPDGGNTTDDTIGLTAASSSTIEHLVDRTSHKIGLRTWLRLPGDIWFQAISPSFFRLRTGAFAHHLTRRALKVPYAPIVLTANVA